MKLHLNTVESTTGLIFKAKVWHMDVRLELSDAEATIIRAHRDIANMVIGEANLSAVEEPVIEQIKIKKLIEGIKGIRFWSIQNQTSCEASIREGCKDLKGHIDRLVQVGTSGPTVEEI